MLWTSRRRAGRFERRLIAVISAACPKRRAPTQGCSVTHQKQSDTDPIIGEDYCGFTCEALLDVGQAGYEKAYLLVGTIRCA